MATECEKEVEQIVQELRSKAEDENPTSLLKSSTAAFARQDAYTEAADMLEERILQG
jgi:hypothetical protein